MYRVLCKRTMKCVRFFGHLSNNKMCTPIKTVCIHYFFPRKKRHLKRHQLASFVSEVELPSMVQILKKLFRIFGFSCHTSHLVNFPLEYQQVVA